MSADLVRERTPRKAQPAIEWRGLPETGTSLETEYTLTGDTIEIRPLPTIQRIPVEKFSQIQRIEGYIREQFNEGIVAVNRNSGDVVLHAVDSHELAERMHQIDIDPAEIVIFRINE